MIRRTFWQGLFGCAAVALLAGCGSDNTPFATTQSNATTKSITAAAGGTVVSGNSTVAIAANTLSQDAAITVTDSPSNLLAAAKTDGLIGSTTISATTGTTLTAGSALTLTLPTGHTASTKYDVDVYRLDSGSPVEVNAIAVTGSTVTFTVPSFGTYAAYDTSKGSSPSFPLTTTADNLTYIDTAVGTGATAVTGSSVSVRYVGAFVGGTVFDSNTAPASSLFTFTIGSPGAITGFSEGVNGMKVGGRRRLSIPPALGYGAAGQSDGNGGYIIPPNATLLFDVYLVSVN